MARKETLLGRFIFAGSLIGGRRQLEKGHVRRIRAPEQFLQEALANRAVVAIQIGRRLRKEERTSKAQRKEMGPRQYLGRKIELPKLERKRIPPDLLEEFKRQQASCAVRMRGGGWQPVLPGQIVLNPKNGKVRFHDSRSMRPPHGAPKVG